MKFPIVVNEEELKIIIDMLMAGANWNMERANEIQNLLDKIKLSFERGNYVI